MPPNPADLAVRQRAVALHKGGDFAAAATMYRDLLLRDPQDFDLNNLLGTALLQAGRAEAAVPPLQAALRLNPQSTATLGNLAIALHRAGQLADAVAAYDALLSRQNDAGLWNNRGVALRDMGQVDDALDSFDRATNLQPGYIDAWVNKGNTLRDAKRVHDAIAAFDRALVLQPNHSSALVGLGWAREENGDFAGALQIIDAQLAQSPADGILYLRRADILRGLRQYDEALKAYTLAVQHRPQDPVVYLRWALFLSDLERFDGAIAAYDMALQLSPDHADAHFGRAEALRRLERDDEAEESYARARTLAPDRVFRTTEPQTAAGFYARGESRRSLNLLTDALADYDRAFALDPDYPGLQGIRLHLRMHLCDWRDYGTVPDMLDKLRAGVPVVQPFPLVGLPATAADQKLSAKLYADAKYPPLPPVWAGEKYAHDKIRIAYLSADFHHHATAHLMAGLFEAHDRQHFEWTALSCGRDDQTPMRQRLEKAFDHFVDLRGMSDAAAARLIRAREIDILVDLKGYTQKSRFAIMTHRPAPVQVTYIGFPGTTASAAIDYAIADPVVIPDALLPHFSEKIIFLPDSYQVNDSKRAIAADIPTRAALGLPERGVVFCSFNQTYKITPDVFAVWMRVLAQVPGSVLWLFSTHDTATENLRRAAAAQGIAAERLVFAGHMPLEAHLARLAQADLFLDTLPCNAHTTASDALWAGVPVLTCAGETFAGRVAASLLSAVGLPEMIAPTMQAYEEKAVQLALDPDALRHLRQRLAQNRLTQPLFDTVRTARHIESAFREIHRRHHAGAAPDHIRIKDLTA